MNELLTCTGLTKQYGSKAALDNLNLTPGPHHRPLTDQTAAARRP